MREHYQLNGILLPNIFLALTHTDRERVNRKKKETEEYDEFGEILEDPIEEPVGGITAKPDEQLVEFVMEYVLPFCHKQKVVSAQQLRSLATNYLWKQTNGPIPVEHIDALLEASWQAIIFRLGEIESRARKEDVTESIISWQMAYALVRIAIKPLAESFNE